MKCVSRLSLGMGIIWYFEILAFLVGDGEEQSWGYFTITDCINMLQVCERDIAKGDV